MPAASRRAGIEQLIEQTLPCGFSTTLTASFTAHGHGALRHRVDQAERLCPAGALGLAGQHHGYRLNRADEMRKAERAAEPGCRRAGSPETEARVVDGDADVAGQPVRDRRRGSSRGSPRSAKAGGRAGRTPRGRASTTLIWAVSVMRVNCAISALATGTGLGRADHQATGRSRSSFSIRR